MDVHRPLEGEWEVRVYSPVVFTEKGMKGDTWVGQTSGVKSIVGNGDTVRGKNSGETLSAAWIVSRKNDLFMYSEGPLPKSSFTFGRSTFSPSLMDPVIL